jgi:voltage-gated potassium channel
MKNVRRHIYALVEPVSYEDTSKQKLDWFDFFIVGLIVANIIAVILGSVERIENKYRNPLYLFELVSVVIFTIEYVLRIWACPENPKYRAPLWGRIRYALTPLLIIDLLAFLPFYLPMVVVVDLRFLRALRLFRIFRLFKLGRYSESLKSVSNVVSAKRGELFITIFLIFILLLVSSSLLYYAEREAQPEKFSSIPASMWWGVVTLTTVGYGDVFPITTLGKIFGSIISFLGIGLFALPAGILSAGFLEEMRKKRTKNKKCPHCGHSLED